MRPLAILQARMTSTRLPGKVMKPILGEPMIGRQIERLRRAERLGAILVATSDDPTDDPLAAYVETLGVAVHRGPLQDVLDRFHGALQICAPDDTFLRLTADCPLADPQLVDHCIERHLSSGADYTHNGPGWTFPKGLDVEVCKVSALEAAWRETRDPYDREHVTPFIYKHPERFRIVTVTRDPPLRYRWTVDTPEDFAFVSDVYAALYPSNPAFTTEDILAWQAEHPDRVIPNIVEP